MLINMGCRACLPDRMSRFSHRKSSFPPRSYRRLDLVARWLEVEGDVSDRKKTEVGGRTVDPFETRCSARNS